MIALILSINLYTHSVNELRIQVSILLDNYHNKARVTYFYSVVLAIASI